MYKLYSNTTHEFMGVHVSRIKSLDWHMDWNCGMDYGMDCGIFAYSKPCTFY